MKAAITEVKLLQLRRNRLSFSGSMSGINDFTSITVLLQREKTALLCTRIAFRHKTLERMLPRLPVRSLPVQKLRPCYLMNAQQCLQFLVT